MTQLEYGRLRRRRANLLFHDLRRTAVRNPRRAKVAHPVIMKITDQRTRSVIDRYNITDHSDTREAGRMAEEFLATEQKSGTKYVTREGKGELG